MSRPDEKGRGPVRRAVKEVFSKGAPAPAKLALPLSLFLLPPAMAAEEPGQEKDDLPVVFIAPPPEVEISEATVERLRAVTAVARLERVAALEPELADLKYSDPKAALMKLGIELPETVKVAVARDVESGEDRATVEGASFEIVLRFDSEGQLIALDEEPAGFASRSDLTDIHKSNFDKALTCCFVSSPYNGWCTTKQACGNGLDKCFSPWFRGLGEASDVGDGTIKCASISGF